MPTAQQLYIQQQQQQVHYANNPSFHHYQPPFQLRQQQYAAAAAAHHHYAPQPQVPQQIMSMSNPAAANTGMPPTMIPDNPALLGTTPHMTYLAAANALQQQQQQQHHTAMIPAASVPATKQSKAIKIVNPETMKEVDTSNLKKTSPSSSARSTPKPTAESEQVQQKFKQNVNKAAVDSKGNNEVTKQPAVTPNAIITQPNQEEPHNVTTVTTDPRPVSQDTVQSSEVQLPSNGGVHQKEPVSEPPVGTEPPAEVSSGSEPLLPQQQQLPKQLEDNGSSSSTEVSESVVEHQPVDTGKVIKEVDNQIAEIQKVVNKPESVTMETLNAELDNGADLEKPDTEFLPVGEANGEKQDVEESNVEKVSVVQKSDTAEIQLEGEQSAEKLNVEKTIPSPEEPIHGEEISSLEECNMEEDLEEALEETTVDELNMEQGESVINKDAGSVEDKSTEESSVLTTIEMEPVETRDSSCVGDSTGPSSLDPEGMDRAQGNVCVWCVYCVTFHNAQNSSWVNTLVEY